MGHGQLGGLPNPLRTTIINSRVTYYPRDRLRDIRNIQLFPINYNAIPSNVKPQTTTLLVFKIYQRSLIIKLKISPIQQGLRPRRHGPHRAFHLRVDGTECNFFIQFHRIFLIQFNSNLFILRHF